MSKGYLEFKGFDPRIPGDGVFRLSLERLDRIRRYAPEAKFKDLFCVKAITEKPAVAFRGLRTVDERFGDPREYVEVPETEGLCLSGRPPKSALNKAGISERDGFVFAVFVDKNLTVLDWDWIRASRYSPDRPVGWEARFIEEIWPRR